MPWIDRALLVSFPILGTAVAIESCSLPNKNDSGFIVTSGTCSGQPAPCPGLSGADCSKVPGCVDRGTCTGVATNTGEACGAMTSFVSCTSTLGCFWQADCTGEAFGTCSAVTEAQCTAVLGCVWTPNAGTGGTGSTCNTFEMSCSADSDCDCGFQCVTLCATCGKVCAHACQSTSDCAGAVGASNQAAPNCQKPDSTATSVGICVP